MQKLVSSLLAGVLGGVLVLGASKMMEKPQVLSKESDPAPVRTVNYAGVTPPFDFVKAAERSMDAVVHIKASESRRAAQERRRDLRDPFELFFGRGFQYEQQPRSGTGSGVIYTTDGYILTNNHVVDFADEFLVTLHDNREFRARLVGRDPDTDMAVIKIDAADLPAITLGNSDEVRVGEWVLAVGNPFDLTSTVTAGIVSAKSRDINIINRNTAIEAFIQTDAAVNPGNSGGALVDVSGNLIGINSAIATPTGTFAGYSFAIPVNLVKRIADDLIKYGEFRRAYLGVDIVAMDQDVAKEAELEYVPGVLVAGLDPGGSAAQAGIKQYDVVTKINGKNVTSVPELRELIGRSKAGDTVPITVLRNGKTQEINVRLKTKSNG